jgi:mRNA-degrading endonuclease toxin of MazEF toxin-antitoxin module
MTQDLPKPSRGEIWDVDFPSDPPGKGPRPVLVVSPNARNHHPKVTTVLVVPFFTKLTGFRHYIPLKPGETGLPAESELRPDNITTVRKEDLRLRQGTRMQSETLIKGVARRLVIFGLMLQPSDLE